MATTTDADDWITYSAARTVLGTSYPTVRRLVDAGEIGQLKVPGARPKVSRSDVYKLLADSTRLARAAEGSTDQP